MDAFRSELVESLGDVIDGDLHHLADIDAGTGELEILQHPTPLPPEVAMAAFAHRHPIVERFLGTGDGSAVRLSDLVTPDEWRATTLHDIYAPHRVNHQLGTTIPYPESRVLAVGVNRDAEDFSATDVAVLDHLRPHLVQSVRNAEVRQRLAELFGTFTAWDLDAVFTSDHEWCQYASLDGIAIHHLQAGCDDEPVTSVRFVWDGHERVLAEPDA